MEKKRVIKSYESLTPELKTQLQEHYPAGYNNHVMRLTNAKNETFFAVSLSTDEANYLIKVPIDIKAIQEEEEEEDDLAGNKSNEQQVTARAQEESYEPNYDDLG